MKNTNEHSKANEQKWDIRAGTFDEKRFNYFRYMQKRGFSIVNLRKGINFLDLGCGTGWAVCYVATLLEEQGNFIGIDISKRMIEKAIENASGLKNVRFYKASSEKLPVQDDFFDIIICTNSFHHYPNPVKALKEAYRVLKEKEKIYILDVTADDFLIKWIDKMIRKKEKGHIKFYSTVEYKNISLQGGLRYIKNKLITYPLKIHIAEKTPNI
jgi:ubiquinone/menaquinone biosynthesis C-methylase UbiE